MIRQQPDTGSRKTLSPFVRIAGSVEHALDGNRSQELFNQAGAGTLAPGVGDCEVLFGLGGYDELSGHSGCGPFV